MPPHEGMQEYQLTDNLLKTLAETRIKFDEYILSQKKSIDEQVSTYENCHSKEQSLINDLVNNLEGVQSERGLNSDENNIGIMQKKCDLNSKQRRLEEFIQDLTRSRKDQEEIVRGK